MPLPLLLGGLGLVGLCGAAVALGGAALLIVAWRRSRRPTPPAVSPPLPTPPPTPALDYGTLVGAGLVPTPLKPGSTTLGRSPENDIALNSGQVSRRHARIDCGEGVCTVEDLQSSNGTFVNGKRVTRSILTPGDRLRLGDIELTYQGAADMARGGAWLETDGVRYPVHPGSVTIGRSSQNDLHLADEQVSRLHARVVLQGNTFVLTDLGSTNGTFVNERRIRQHPLRDGDEIRIGRSRLRFCMRAR